MWYVRSVCATPTNRKPRRFGSGRGTPGPGAERVECSTRETARVRVCYGTGISPLALHRWLFHFPSSLVALTPVVRRRSASYIYQVYAGVVTPSSEDSCSLPFILLAYVTTFFARFGASLYIFA